MRTFKAPRLLFLYGLLTVGNFPADAAEHADSLSKQDAKDGLSDELSWLRAEATVFSGARREQKVSDTAVAVFVLSNEDIKRSGATSLPEALRMAPGIHVARIDANKWAISIRGFNERFSNKLLVLMDGRTVYNPLFSGVYWDAQDILLDDVERIEVIRGPGAALWGANAVNGVINVISKSAKTTQGGLVSGGYGSEEQGFAAVRYGGEVADNLQYRLYAKRFNRGDSFSNLAAGAQDRSTVNSGGFRLDWQPGKREELSLQGRYYEGQSGQQTQVPRFSAPWMVPNDQSVGISGGHILGRWRNRPADASETILQLYFDHAQRNDAVLGRQTLNTSDISYQYRFAWLDGHELTWGANYRSVDNRLDPGYEAWLQPEHRHISLYSGFIRDDIKLAEHWNFIVGTELQHNDFTGVEVQPTARLLWHPQARHTVWAAVSRAVRTPAIEDHDLTFMPVMANPTASLPVPVAAQVQGNQAFTSENLMAYELGYRFAPNSRFSLDTTAFYNVYDNLRTFEQGAFYFDTVPTSHLVVPYAFDNRMKASSHGSETVIQWTVQDNWRLSANYQFISMRFDTDDGSTDYITLDRIYGHAPQQQFALRSLWNMDKNWQLDLWARYVDQMRWEPSVLSPQNGGLPFPMLVSAYITLDARLAWKPLKDLEISLVGQNLLDGHHQEYIDKSTNIPVSQVERSAYIKAEWHF